MRIVTAARRFGRTGFLAALLPILLFGGCDGADNPLADYQGERPLIIQRVTQSFAPDVQWVGGRVAAIGINRGERAALDSTLVWIHQVDGDQISAPVFVRDVLDADIVESFGGAPTDSLDADQTYTVWLATAEALSAQLDTTLVDEHSFADSTFTTRYLLNGRSFGGVSVEFRIFRDQRLTSDRYTATWTPADQAFRRVAINNATVGSFNTSTLIWHIVLPDDQEDSIRSPLVIGSTPEDAIVAVEWDGFGQGAHTFWAATDQWDGQSFGFRTPGYAFFQINASNKFD